MGRKIIKNRLMTLSRSVRSDFTRGGTFTFAEGIKPTSDESDN